MPPTITLPSIETLSLIQPELWLVAGMCAVIFVPFIKRDSVTLPAGAAIIALLLALGSAIWTLTALGIDGQYVFANMLAIDRFSQFFKILLCLFTLLVVVQWLIASRRLTHVLDVPDFLCLLLGATFGMAMMASASNLLMIFIATETASLPSYALAGFRKRQRTGSEGSLKYVLFGAVASAVMLYGMSLLYGSAGTLDLAGIGHGLDAKGMTPMFAVGLLAFFAGIAFKLSAVPMHFWCPDVFEGAPIEVTTFLSVASKGAAVCLLVRVLLALSAAAMGPSLHGLAICVAALGAVTATWGNLVAYHQNNIKRMLAYSSIAHAGYMIMAVSVAAVGPVTPELSQTVASSILFYLLVYLFMNLGAFTVAGLIAQATGSYDIREYVGMSRRSPVLAAMLAVFLLSLFGMPGLGGFMGKIYLMVVMAGGQNSIEHPSAIGLWGFFLIAALLLNTALSLYFYLRPVRLMFLATDTDRPAFLPRGAGIALLLLCAGALLWTGVYPSSAANLTNVHGRLLVGQVVAPVATVTAPAKVMSGP